MAKIRSFGVAITVATNAIGGVESITIPETEMTDIDITTHDSTGGYKEYVGGLKDGGIVQINGKYDIGNTGQTYLRTAANQTGTAVACEITFSDGSTCSFDAVLKGYGVDNPLDEAVTFTASLRISGAVVYAAGA